MGKLGYNHGDFGWNELATDNPAKAIAFYTEIFGWKTEEMEMPCQDADGNTSTNTYTVLVNGEEKVGGILAKSPEQANAPTAWMPYLTVDNVDQSVEKIFDLGGKVIAPPFDVPVEDGPRIAIIQDPGGATLGIITYVNQADEVLA
ncbi:VOC family protein [Pelagicoccus mobilis]|uniref:VOC family protein n=1 Tax=Pelagicoccus mobilis TaxID=415221 RepID=A0A934S709_9BACT|nr:VOC family protein [Pelagicoccus mobilis]MBK1880539.1 VOC family protein [Pelagicoccus mobilis]